VIAPAGTVAVILIDVLTMKAPAVPLNVTADAPAKLTPFIVTLVPTTPLAGAKLVIRGATVKLVVLVAVPPGVVTAIGPVVALPGTVIVILTLELTVKGAVRPLSLTEVAPMKFVPLIVTGTPAPAPTGEKLLIVGVRITVKVVALVACRRPSSPRCVLSWPRRARSP
jgi:hypothetical protein